jgi:hypothetical protein
MLGYSESQESESKTRAKYPVDNYGHIIHCTFTLTL